jgi:PTH2 family peptidyl-tRNA hydrolase
MIGQRMVILVNSNAKMSRGKFAAQAVHAALILRGVHHGGPVIVLGGKPAEIEDMPTVVHDAGWTELEPGTLTAGARWEGEQATEPVKSQSSGAIGDLHSPPPSPCENHVWGDPELFIRVVNSQPVISDYQVQVCPLCSSVRTAE